jgi:non-specific serine/threonine protein kinase/serine/threonine-protein kinase
MFSQRGIDDIRKTIREVEPPRPSTRVLQLRPATDELAVRRRTEPSRLAAGLRGDLDWVVLKALDKDRTKRYQTANAFALDLRRHLADEPVSASPPSASYRIHKFIRRHRLAVTAAAVMILLLVGFSVLTLLQSARIARERDRANREAQTAQHVLSFLVGLFNISDPSEARGNAVTAREVLDRGAETIDQTLKMQPEVQARLEVTIGRVYMNLGFYRKARELLERAVAKYRTVAGDDSPDTMTALSGVADALWSLGQVSDAEGIYRDLASRRARLLGADHVDTLKSQFDLASAYAVQDRLQEAEALTRQTLETQRRTLGKEHLDTLATLNNLGAILHRQKRHQEELEATAELLETRRRVFGEDHPDSLRSYNNLGINYVDLRRWSEAERLLQAAVNGRKRVLGETHPATVHSLTNLASAYREQGKYIEAERELLQLASLLGVDENGDVPVSSIAPEGGSVNLARELARLYTAWGQVEKASRWSLRVQ